MSPRISASGSGRRVGTAKEYKILKRQLKSLLKIPAKAFPPSGSSNGAAPVLDQVRSRLADHKLDLNVLDSAIE